MRDTSIFAKLSHFLLLGGYFLLSLLLFEAALLLWVERSQLCLVFEPLLAFLFELFFFNLVLLVFIFNGINLFAYSLSLGAI